jgi:O-antigen/teichoic acid export membrane protein
LLARSSIARSSLWNLAGLGVPLAAAVIAVPFIIRGLGIERFGILALAWAIMGAAAMLDLGVGRALTQLVAKRRAALETAELDSLVVTATAFLAALAIAGAALLAAAAAWLANDVFRVDPMFTGEARDAIALLAAGLPFVLCGAALQGVLEGHLRFDLSNLVRIPLSALNYLVPLAILPLTADLVWIVAGIVCARILGFLVYAALVRHVMDARGRRASIRPLLLRPVLALGGWMAASTVVAALIVYLDRFAIGALLTMTALAFYVTPFEIVSRLSIIPGAVGGALLPAFASVTRAAPEQMANYFTRGVRYVVLPVFPAAMLVVLFAHEGLTLWIGEEFAAGSARIAQILAVGLFVNSLAMIPLIFLYGVGRADMVAKLHFLELPAYAIVLWQLVPLWGADGAALAWTLRALIDAVMLFGISRRLYPTQDFRYARIAIAMLTGVGALAFGCFIASTAGRFAYGVLTLGIFAAYGWMRLLTVQERLALATAINRKAKRSH